MRLIDWIAFGMCIGGAALAILLIWEDRH